MNQVMVVLLLWGLIGALVGAAIGKNKGRPEAGAIFGFLLGPVGWLLVAVGPNMLRKCPECRGVIPEGASRCMHCKAEIGMRSAG